MALNRRWRTITSGPREGHYDARVLKRLRQLHRQAIPVIDDLVSAQVRFDRYEVADRRVLAGELDFFAEPVLDSYHAACFELHRDLLVTLGRDRAEEAS